MNNENKRNELINKVISINDLLEHLKNKSELVYKEIENEFLNEFLNDYELNEIYLKLKNTICSLSLNKEIELLKTEKKPQKRKTHFFKPTSAIYIFDPSIYTDEFVKNSMFMDLDGCDLIDDADAVALNRNVFIENDLNDITEFALNFDDYAKNIGVKKIIAVADYNDYLKQYEFSKLSKAFFKLISDKSCVFFRGKKRTIELIAYDGAIVNYKFYYIDQNNKKCAIDYDLFMNLMK